MCLYHRPTEDEELYWTNRELRELAREPRMSMDRCWKCSAPVDTDEDLDCYVPVGGIGEDGVAWDYECTCENCRNKQEAETQAQYARTA